MLTWLTRDGKVLLLAKGLRTVAYGAFSVLLGVYLSLLGLDAWAVGLTLAAALAGDALLTLGVTFVADRMGRRRTLVLLAMVGAVGGLLFLSVEWGPLLLLFALLSGLSTTGKESGPFLTIEAGIFPQTCPPERRTLLFSLANLISEGGAALGALASAAPVVIAALLGLSTLASYRLLLGIAAGAGLAAVALYLLLSSGVELQAERQGRGLSPSSRGRVARLGLLFAVDAAGGGVIVQSFLAYWFHSQLGFTPEALALLFSIGSVLAALSTLAAAPLSQRVGLVNTMVFTHLPSNLFLMAIPFAPWAPLAAALYLARQSLSQMDVPTRQSYVVSIVAPEERTAAAGLTSLPRYAARAVGPIVSAALLPLSPAGPFLAGGGLKVLYDLSLFLLFRKVRPPEEVMRDAAAASPPQDDPPRDSQRP